TKDPGAGSMARARFVRGRSTTDAAADLPKADAADMARGQLRSPQEAPTVSVFSLDPFHPDVLRCLDCGQAVANVAELAQADEPHQQRTARQALRRSPRAPSPLLA